VFKLAHSVVDIGVICSNFEESLRFYRDLLGMEVVFEIEIPGDFTRKVGLSPSGFRQVRLQAGDTLIKLAELKSSAPTASFEFKSGVRWLTFIVDDVQATFAELRRKGVQFLSEPTESPDAVGVVCARDPDGILIELVQLK
jgi:glyoxylase I family protein